MADVSNYDKLREDTQKFYSGIMKVHSPVLGYDIHFNAEGFNHIILKNARSERDKVSQISRFKLLALASKLIAISTTFQEFEETIKEFEVKRFKKRIKQSKSIKYWGIIAIIEGRKIKVILRKMGDGGTVHFWSVIPGWVTNKYRDTRFITTMRGNPEED
jgi:IS4 transposase